MKGLLSALVVALALPAIASANSGSITDVHSNGDGTVDATYSVTFDQCTSDGYCGFYAHAWEVPADQACAVDPKLLAYVSTGTSETSGTLTETDSFAPNYTPTRICLYAYGAVGGGTGSQEYYIADYVYPPRDAVQPMTIAEARSYVPDVLRQKYKRRFARGTLTRACSRLSRRKVRCRVGWHKKPFRYSGTVTMWNDEDDPDSFIYRTSIRRKRVVSSHAGSRAGGGGGPAPAPAQPSCNPSYEGACLPLTGDVDCGEIAAHDFRSVGSDPFRLDGDGDGIACES
jgi:hypothetical protein